MSDSFVNAKYNQIWDNIIARELEKGVSEQEIKRKLEQMPHDETFQNYISYFSEQVLAISKAAMYEDVCKHRFDSDHFVSRLNLIWGEAFVAYEAFYLLITDASEMHTEHIHKMDQSEYEETQFTFLALHQLHGRACQVYLEILCLMQNGFADAAVARWRTLYELTVTASFIYKYGEDVAFAFYNDPDHNDRKEWAKKAECFHNRKGRIPFSDIEEKSDIARNLWESAHKTAHKVVHASPEGTFTRFGIKNKQDKVTLVGRSDYGIDTPAVNSAISLMQTTCIFLSLHANWDCVVMQRYIVEWVDIVQDAFVKASGDHFDHIDPSIDPPPCEEI